MPLFNRGVNMTDFTKLKLTILASLTPALFLAGTTDAAAQSASAEMNVQAQVQKACSLSASGINFGTVDTLSANAATATGTITVTCTAGTDWRTYADNGEGPTNGRIDTAHGREMVLVGGGASSPVLRYNLYRDAAHAFQYGNAVDGGEEINNLSDASSTKNGLPVTKTVYGKVFTGQHTVASGSYADRVLITLTIV